MTPEERTERIRRRAYELWEQAGRPEGRQAEHWEQAEREMAAEEGEPRATGRTGADQARSSGLATGDLGPGGDSTGAVAGGGTATGIGSAAGDARPPGAKPAGTRGAGGTRGRGKAVDSGGAGGPATPATGAGGAEGGGGPGVGGSQDGTTGVTGYGSAATGHPSSATAGDAPGREIPVSPEDRARGITEQRTASVVQNAPAAREAGGPGSGAGQSEQFGKHGSGSTTNVPGGKAAAQEGEGEVGGARGGGIGSPGAPTESPIADARVRGAGARSKRTRKGEKDTATDVGREQAKRERKRT